MILIITSGLISYSTNNTISIHIIDQEIYKERISDKNGYYIIYTDNENFVCKDSIWFWHFRSSDTYRKIERNKDYKVKVIGFRWGFATSYRNIIKILE